MRQSILSRIAVVVLIPAALGAQSAPATFIITSGMDTVAVEQFTRTGNTFVGDLRLAQQGTHTHYVVQSRADASAERVDVIDDARNFFTGTIAFDASGALAARRAGGGVRDKVVVAPPHSEPVVGVSIALMERLVRMAHPAAGDSTRIQVYNIRNRFVGVATIKRLGRDSVQVVCDGCQRVDSHQELRLALDAAGDVTGGTSPQQEWVISRR